MFKTLEQEYQDIVKMIAPYGDYPEYRAYCELQDRLKAKSAEILSRLSSPFVTEAQSERLSEQYFDLQDQIKLAA